MSANPVNPNTDLMTREEVAAYLRVTVPWLKKNGPPTLAYYRRPVMYSRVVCEAWLRRDEPLPPSADPVQPRDVESGCSIYFVESGPGGPLKIGTAADVSKRIGHLQTGNPEALTLVLEIPGGESREKRLHELFHKDRIRGEWFRRSAEIVTFIDRSQVEARELRERQRSADLREAKERSERVARALGMDGGTIE